MTHVCSDRQLHRILVEALGGSRASHAPAVFLARARSDAFRATGRTAWEHLRNAVRKARDKLRIELGPACRCAVAAPRPRLRVIQALGLGPFERLFLNQHALALVAFPRTTPLQHHGRQPRVLAGAPRDGRIAGG
jgi:hypothetical protein